ncbi:MAG: peptide-methionine (S)-S-oxide reductase MsrA [Methanomassiliicoccales archaeon]
MESEGKEVATFGAGCFWGVESTFRRVKGVLATEVGYMGGTMENPTYRDVCTGMTGHAEVVQVTYDPGKVSYDDLLEVFWRAHDPTTKDRQGPDVGTQYRSVIFYHDEDQRERAERSKREVQERLRGRVVTTIEPASTLWRAEEYHQRYFEKMGR